MTTTHYSKYFCGNEISQYGQQQGYLDYRTLAKAFDAVLVNDITKLFYASVNGAWIEVEQINGYIDNSEQIDELKEQIDELDDAEQITALEEQIDELEREQDEQPEIFQYYIVSAAGADILQEYTNDPLFYIDHLDMYVWGVTHWGTAWDYVLTDVKLEV
jgi:cell division protein FtsB